MKAWFWKLLVSLLNGRTELRIQSLEDQAKAYRQTIAALKTERGRMMGDYDALLDRHEQLQRVHRELEQRYTALREPRSADWMLGQQAARRAHV